VRPICIKLGQLRDIGATPTPKWSFSISRNAEFGRPKGCHARWADASSRSTTVNSMGVQDMFVRSLTLGVAAAALLVGGAQAADLIIPTTPQPIYEAAGFDWEGLYVGVRAGGQFVGTDGVNHYNNYPVSST